MSQEINEGQVGCQLVLDGDLRPLTDQIQFGMPSLAPGCPGSECGL